MRFIFGFIVLVISSITILNFMDSTVITEYQNVTILDKQQQQLIKESHTDYRYIVITDKGTFICETSVFNSKFNNSDIFWKIKKDSTYSNIKVAGYGKGFLFDYKNILEIK